MSFMYELDPYSLEYTGCANMNFKNFESYRLTNIQTDRQTRPKLYTTPLRGWSTM